MIKEKLKCIVTNLIIKGYNHEGILQYGKILGLKGYTENEIFEKIKIEKNLIINEWDEINEEYEKERIKDQINGILRAGLGRKDQNNKYNTYIDYKKMIFWIKYNMIGEIVNELKEKKIFIGEQSENYKLI